MHVLVIERLMASLSYHKICLHYSWNLTQLGRLISKDIYMQRDINDNIQLMTTYNNHIHVIVFFITD